MSKPVFFTTDFSPPYEALEEVNKCLQKFALPYKFHNLDAGTSDYFFVLVKNGEKVPTVDECYNWENDHA